ncbi:hypothetical protein DM860_017600 [Cuscuta australis]|uniref:Endonuclease/exonuclease/phosphatase domain-containing protein n=1 Tax=Cuscuta australis TaxID=267555 RepID=A0A328DB61_9ASTE|nr:hypothetical protein DM860_017600 [Cuscuta australis]
MLEVMNTSHDKWTFAVEYASPTPHLRQKLWNTLKRDNLNITTPWIAAGDFNSVTKREEVSNPDHFEAHRCSRFNEWTFDEAMIDLGFIGQCFTWKRGTDNVNFKGARLDRVLCSIDWLDRNTKTEVRHLASSKYDQILISLGDQSGTKRVGLNIKGRGSHIPTSST